MINFAKLSKVPPRKRMAAALRGFGFGSVPSAAQHLRGLGLSMVPITAPAPVPAPAPAPMTAAAMSAAIQAVVSPRQLTLVPTGMKTFSVAAPLEQVRAALPPPPAPAPAPAPRNTLRAPPLAVEPERTQVEDTQTFPEGREETFPEGREETFPEETISPSDVEEGGGGFPEGTPGGGGFPEGTPGDGSEPKVDKKKAALKLAQSGGWMDKVKALPMPAKVIGGVAIAYVVWKVLE